jgi:carbamate kinase
MLCVATGQERTEAEHAELLDRAGFRLTRVIPSPTPMSIVEAVPAEVRVPGPAEVRVPGGAH